MANTEAYKEYIRLTDKLKLLQMDTGKIRQQWSFGMLTNEEAVNQTLELLYNTVLEIDREVQS